jgi:hypothetical protein
LLRLAGSSPSTLQSSRHPRWTFRSTPIAQHRHGRVTRNCAVRVSSMWPVSQRPVM